MNRKFFTFIVDLAKNVLDKYITENMQEIITHFSLYIVNCDINHRRERISSITINSIFI